MLASDQMQLLMDLNIPINKLPLDKVQHKKKNANCPSSINFENSQQSIEPPDTATIKHCRGDCMVLSGFKFVDWTLIQIIDIIDPAWMACIPNKPQTRIITMQ